MSHLMSLIEIPKLGKWVTVWGPPWSHSPHFDSTKGHPCRTPFIAQLSPLLVPRSGGPCTPKAVVCPELLSSPPSPGDLPRAGLVSPNPPAADDRMCTGKGGQDSGSGCLSSDEG